MLLFRTTMLGVIYYSAIDNLKKKNKRAFSRRWRRAIQGIRQTWVKKSASWANCFPSPSLICKMGLGKPGWTPQLPIVLLPMNLLYDVLESNAAFSECFIREPEGVLTLHTSQNTIYSLFDISLHPKVPLQWGHQGDVLLQSFPTEWLVLRSAFHLLLKR